MMKQDLDMIKGIKISIFRYCHLKFMIFPDDPTKLIWDILIVIALLYICFVVPFEISFREDDSTESDV